MSVNRYICTGNLTKDPELRQLATGAAVCELRVAVDGMGRGPEVGYVTVSVFGKPGEAAARHLSKGSLVAIDGRLQYEEWATAEEQKRHDYSIVGSVEFLVLTTSGQAEPSTSPGVQPVAA